MTNHNHLQVAGCHEETGNSYQIPLYIVYLLAVSVRQYSIRLSYSCYVETEYHVTVLIKFGVVLHVAKSRDNALVYSVYNYIAGYIGSTILLA